MVGKVILVTGASTGLGAAIAIQAGRRSNAVYATMRDLKKVDAVAAAASAAGAKLSYLPLDVQDIKSVDAAIGEVIKREGRIDTLVNNAGSGYARPTEQASWEDIQWIMDVNLMGVIRVTKAVLPHMRKAHSGHIVNISSVGGLVGQPFNEIYCASKFALEGLSDALRLELAGTGIHVSLIEPGPIRTRFVEHALAVAKANIDIAGSVHRVRYEALIDGLARGGKQTFKLEPEAVVARLVHAVESPRPKARYFVTTPTYAAAFLKRVLPTRALDLFARRG